MKRYQKFATTILSILCFFAVFTTGSVRALAQDDNCTSITGPNDPAVLDMIEKGVPWLISKQNADGSWGSSNRVAETGLAVTVLEDYLASKGKAICADPTEGWSELELAARDAAIKGLNYILSKQEIRDISVQPAGDPDTNHNGKGIVFYDSSNHEIYEGAIAMMAIASSRCPILQTGTDLTLSDNSTFTLTAVDVAGDGTNDTLNEVLQDLVDYYAYAQNDEDTGSARGGWRYTANSGDSDNSNTGWVTFGLGFAQTPIYGFSVTIPQFVLDELNIWIDYIQNDVNGDANDGGSGYDSPNYWVNILKTGHLLYEMYLVGDDMTSPRVKAAVDYIARHWNDPNDEPGWRSNGGASNYHAIFNMVKGFGALGFKTVDGHDWYQEFAQAICEEKNSIDFDGNDQYYWSGCNWGNDILCTEWAILSLQRVVPVNFTEIGNVTVDYIGETSGCLGDEVSLSARLTDEDGKPISNQELQFVFMMGDKALQTVPAQTDENGTASVTTTLDFDLEEPDLDLINGQNQDEGFNATFKSDHVYLLVRYVGAKVDTDGDGKPDKEYSGAREQTDFDLSTTYEWDFDGDSKGDLNANGTTAWIVDHIYPNDCPAKYWPKVRIKFCQRAVDNSTTDAPTPWSDAKRVVVEPPGIYIVKAYAIDTQRIKVIFNKPLNMATVDNTDFCLQMPDGRKIPKPHTNEEIKIEDINNWGEYSVTLHVINYEWEMGDTGSICLSGKDVIESSDGEGNVVACEGCNGTCRTVVGPPPDVQIGAFDTDNDNQIDHFAIYYSGGFAVPESNATVNGINMNISTEQLSGIWDRPYEWNITNATLINDHTLWVTVGESGYFDDLHRTPCFDLKVSSLGNLTDLSGNALDLDLFGYDGNLSTCRENRYNLYPPKISKAEFSGCEIRVVIDGAVDPATIDPSDFVLTLGQDTEFKIAGMWTNEWAGQTTVFLMPKSSDECFDCTAGGTVAFADPGVVATYPAGIFGLTVQNKDTSSVELEPCEESGPYVDTFSLDTNNDGMIDRFVLYSGCEEVFEGSLDPNSTIEVSTEDIYGRPYTWNVTSTKLSDDGHHLVIEVEPSGFADKNTMAAINISNSGLSLNGQSIDGQYMAYQTFEPKNPGLNAWYDPVNNQLHVWLDLPYSASGSNWRESNWYNDATFLSSNRSPADDFEGMNVDLSGATYVNSGSCCGELVIQLAQNALAVPGNGESVTYSITLKEQNGLSYARLGLPVTGGFFADFWAPISEINNGHIYVMDITGQVTDNENIVSRAAVTAWVMKKHGTGSVFINYNGLSYHWEDYEGLFDRAFERHQSTTFYLKFAKGVPVDISSSAELEPDEWEAKAVTFNPTTGQILLGEKVIGYVPYYWGPWGSSPVARAYTDENGHYLLHVINNVSAGDPVVLTVTRQTAEGFRMVPVTGVASADADFYINFNAVYNKDEGKAYSHDINLAMTQEAPIQTASFERGQWSMIAVPVKKVYYRDSDSIPSLVPKNWPEVPVDNNLSDAEIIMRDGVPYSGDLRWGTEMLGADDKGIHYNYGGQGDLKALVGGHAYLVGHEWSSEGFACIHESSEKYYFFGEPLGDTDSFTLSPAGQNNGWYILYNWTNQSVADILNADVDYVMTLTDGGYRSQDDAGSGDLLKATDPSMVIIHTGAQTTWPVPTP